MASTGHAQVCPQADQNDPGEFVGVGDKRQMGTVVLGVQRQMRRCEEVSTTIVEAQ